MAIYKEEEFKAFLATIKSGQSAHWAEIAKALGVDADTITKWKKLPEAQAAIREGIEFALSKMQEAGSKDWRMWEKKLNMLGVIPSQEVKLDASENTIEAIIKLYGGGGGAKVDELPTTENRPSSDSA